MPVSIRLTTQGRDMYKKLLYEIENSPEGLFPYQYLCGVTTYERCEF